MNAFLENFGLTAPRRFVLLPEETADRSMQGPRIRRYRLSSVGLCAERPRAADGAAAAVRAARTPPGVGGL